MKKIVAIVILIGLVIWGVYDVGKNKSTNPETKSNTASVQPGTDKGQQLTVGLQKGNLAPDFELRTLDGQVIKLSSLRGKKVIVNMWATWCPPCRLEMPDMEKFYAKHKNEGIEILAVNLTKAEKSREDVPKFVKDFGITFPVLMDEKGEVAQMYEASAIPTSYILDSKGVIQQKIVGPMNEETMKELLGGIK
ncbi:MAG: peroxiredoxin family protein [Desulfitobacteriaceae bacterium]